MLLEISQGQNKCIYKGSFIILRYMVEYNLVKECGLCKKKFTVPKKEFKRIYCKECQAKVNKANK